MKSRRIFKVFSVTGPCQAQPLLIVVKETTKTQAVYSPFTLRKDDCRGLATLVIFRVTEVQFVGFVTIFLYPDKQNLRWRVLEPLVYLV